MGIVLWLLLKEPSQICFLDPPRGLDLPELPTVEDRLREQFCHSASGSLACETWIFIRVW